MFVTDEQVALLRAYVHGNGEAATSAWGRITSPAGLAALTDAAFVTAARRKFAPTWTKQQVIQYVARLRALISDSLGTLDPRTAEQELCRALSGQQPLADPAASHVSAQLVLLAILVADLDLDDDGIDELLRQSRASVG